MRKLYLAAAISILFVSGYKEPALNGAAGIETIKTSPMETAKADILLTSAPEIALTDVLSSTINKFEIQSSSYSWNYKEGKGITRVAACGMHPLDPNMQNNTKLSVPEYNGIDSASYIVTCLIPPDRLTVREWDESKLGDTEAVQNAEVISEGLYVDLKPHMIYEIIAKWDQESFEINGFYGEASYVFLTQ